jgi:hypothetical protein
MGKGNRNPELHPENLIPFHKRSPEEAQRIRKMGNEANLKKMRERKTFKNILDCLLSHKITDKNKIKKTLEKFPDLKEKDLDQKMLFAIKFAQQVANSDGDEFRRNFLSLRDTMGEQPVIKKAKTDSEGQDVPIINDDV